MMVTLDDIIGQAAPVAILKRGLATASLGHAYLFSGPAGLGKASTAKAVAAELKKEGGPYSQIYTYDEAGSIGVEEMRALRKQAALSSTGKQIWVITDAERLTIPAANAFLKTLEEPGADTYFFLTTTNVHDLLPTIVSRCQHLPFRPVAEAEIRRWLAQANGVDAQDPRVVLAARAARGSLGKAWDYFQGPQLAWREEIIEKLVRIPKAPYAEVLGLSQAWPEDREKIFSDLQVILEWHRDLLTIKGQTRSPLYNPQREEELRELSSRYSYSVLYQIIKQISKTRAALAGNARIRFSLGYLLLLIKKGALT